MTLKKGQMVKWSNIFYTHPFYSSVQANNIYIIINYYIYIIEEEVRKIWGVLKKTFDHLTIWPCNEIDWCCKLLIISDLNKVFEMNLKRTKVKQFCLCRFPFFSGWSNISIVELTKLGTKISKTTNVTIFMLSWKCKNMTSLNDCFSIGACNSLRYYHGQMVKWSNIF